ncbi:MAG: hypothetical protein QM758_01455 [Armatimonas sp.]
MLRKAAMVFFVLSGLVVAVGAVAFPPIEKRQTSQQEGLLVEKTYKRYWKVLPISVWGFTPIETIADGGSGGGGWYTRRFGFIGLREDHWTQYTRSSEPKQNTLILKSQ